MCVVYKVILLILFSGVYSKCPVREEITPCVCSKSFAKLSEIICKGQFVRSVSVKLRFSNQIIFSTLKVDATNIKSLNENDINNAQFEKIWIKNNNLLERISNNAFKKQPNHLIVENNKKLSENNLFSLSKLLSKTKIIEYKYMSIRVVPMNAF
jgi:hypothetical protein